MIQFNKSFFFGLTFGVFFLIGKSSYGQYTSITGTSISDDNLKIDISFTQEIYSNTSCSTSTCIDVNDFSLTISGGNATLASNTPITITKLGNYNFNPNWNGGEPNNAGGEDYAQHVGTGFLNDLPNSVLLDGVLEVITSSSPTIAGYTYFATWPQGSDCAHSYYRANIAKSWTDSKADATAAGIALGIGADLLVYNSQEEFDYLLNNHANGNGTANTWIGLRQYPGAADYSEPRGGWYWDDGTPIDNSAAPLTYQLTFALNGTPDGNEEIRVNPVINPQSIFNCAGAPALIQNGTNVVNLVDKMNPYILSSTISDDNTKVRVIFNEPIFTDAARNSIQNTDFVLSLVQNGSAANLTAVNPTAINSFRNVYDLFLPMNGLPITGKEVLTISLVAGTVFDASTNTASSVQSNNIADFNPPKTGPVYLSNIYKTSTVSGSISIGSETFLCDEITSNNYNQAYHDGIVLEPQVGNYMLYNRNHTYPSTMVQGSNFAYFHLQGFDKILEIQKSDGLIVAIYTCN